MPKKSNYVCGVAVARLKAKIERLQAANKKTRKKAKARKKASDIDFRDWQKKNAPGIKKMVAAKHDKTMAGMSAADKKLYKSLGWLEPGKKKKPSRLGHVDPSISAAIRSLDKS